MDSLPANELRDNISKEHRKLPPLCFPRSKCNFSLAGKAKCHVHRWKWRKRGYCLGSQSTSVMSPQLRENWYFLLKPRRLLTWPCTHSQLDECRLYQCRSVSSKGRTPGRGPVIVCIGLASLYAFYFGLKKKKPLRSRLYNEINFYTLLVCSFIMELNVL